MKSDQQTWDRLQELFHLADATPEAERDRVLTAACSDPELRARVLAIVDGARKSEATRVEASSLADSRGKTSIGPYVVIRPLGSGGMGSVFLVEREISGIRQRAALKILGPHAAGPSFVDRFYREQRNLAVLEHPNITRMLDAGILEDGQPYLVMEYVEGQPLDEYCDTRKLGVEMRLQLFLKVCAAVDYAHRNLIVHLDLKPSNILVTEDGAPKLLDFGTSKLLHAGGELTSTVSATPSYASPEQLRNEAVTTACDVYSLGVVLFELLTGRRPWGDASIAALIERAIDEREPFRPERVVTPVAAETRGVTETRLRAALSGDLSTILRKCLSARPQDRYPSVNELAMDLERYLAGRPVLARPQTILYRAKKFVRRNSGKVAAAAVVLLALGGALGYAQWRQRQAILEGQRALRMQTFMSRLFEIANSNFTGKPVTSVQEFLQLGVKMLPEYIKDPKDLREAQLALAQSMFYSRDYDNALHVWNDVIRTAVPAGDFAAEAEATSYTGYADFLQGRKDLSLSRTSRGLELSRAPEIPPRVRQLCIIGYTAVREEMGTHTDENLQLLRSAVDISRKSNLPPYEIAQALYFYGSALALRGRLDEATQQFNDALHYYGQDPVAICDEVNVYYGLSTVSKRRGNVDEEAALVRKAYDTSAECRGAEDTESLRFNTFWANALTDAGKSAEAVSILEASLPIWRRVFPRNSIYLNDELYSLGRAYVRSGRYKDGEALARESLGLLAGLVPATDGRFGRAHFLLGQALAGEGRHLEALTEYSLAAPIISNEASSPESKDTQDRLNAAIIESRAKIKKP